jgi:hypothetical protein
MCVCGVVRVNQEQAHIFVEAATGTPTTEGSIMGGIDDFHFPPFEEAMGNR